MSLSVEAGEMTLDVGDKLIASELNTSIGGPDASLEPLDEDGVRDTRAQKGAAARAHKKKTAAQVSDLCTPPTPPHPTHIHARCAYHSPTRAWN